MTLGRAVAEVSDTPMQAVPLWAMSTVLAETAHAAIVDDRTELQKCHHPSDNPPAVVGTIDASLMMVGAHFAKTPLPVG